MNTHLVVATLVVAATLSACSGDSTQESTPSAACSLLSTEGVAAIIGSAPDEAKDASSQGTADCQWDAEASPFTLSLTAHQEAAAGAPGTTPRSGCAPVTAPEVVGDICVNVPATGDQAAVVNAQWKGYRIYLRIGPTTEPLDRGQATEALDNAVTEIKSNLDEDTFARSK